MPNLQEIGDAHSSSSISVERMIFLHIPKTAGQSVHHFLSYFFSKDEVAPARVNEQLATMSINEMRTYKLFSGHLDWSLLDCLDGRKFTFTVLREPVERIVSFYLFLRREAQRLSKDELNHPANSGKKAVLELSCDDYFLAGPPGLRTFLDNHYDNFYSYYFAGRKYDARQRLRGLIHINERFSEEKMFEMALDNLSILNGVYPVNRLDKLEDDIRKLVHKLNGGPTLKTLRVNTGDSNSVEERMMQLEKLGATKKTFTRIEQMTALDKEIWLRYNQSPSWSG